MGWDSGALAFRMFHVPRGVTSATVADFARDAAPPLDTLSREPIHGWVSGRHLLDRVITEDNAIVAGHLRLTLMKAERKIPEALLRAECRMEELALMQAEDKPFLKRQDRAAIKKEVTERLLPKMPPTLTGIPFVLDLHEQVLYAGAMSEKQLDAFVSAFRGTAGVAPVLLTPETTALRLKKVNARDLTPTSFAPDVETPEGESSLGREFLTWLWFYSERKGGMATTGDGGSFGLALEGPLRFVGERDGAYETLLRKGTPLVSNEAKTALTGGKLLRGARILMARENENWTWTLDADEFVFRGVQLPKGEAALDPVSRFHDRMLRLAAMREGFLAFYERFLEERQTAKTWSPTVAEMREWIASRPSRP